MASFSESEAFSERRNLSDFTTSTPEMCNGYTAGASVNGEADSRSSTYSHSSAITHVTEHKTQLKSSLKKRSSTKRVTIQEKGTEETESLNDKLNSFTEKLQILEQQKQMLEDRWTHLQEQEISQSNQIDMEPLYQTYISKLLKDVTKINKENNDIQSKLTGMMDSVDDFKDKYEDEFNTRIDLEYSFVQLKKDLDSISLDNTQLETQVNEVQGTIQLMKSIYEEEMKDLKNNIKDISVVLEMDNRCTVDLEGIVKDVRERYEAIAAKSREDAEALCKAKLNEKAAKAGKYGNDLIKSRSDITDLNMKIQKMRSEMLAMQDQSIHLENAITESKENGESATKDAEAKLAELESALQKAKQDIARQVREHQELMNIKLSLDMEIVTYKKLLEGEESRMQVPTAAIISVQTGPSRSLQKGRASEWEGRPNPEPRRKNHSKNLLIKAIEHHTQVHSK
ncbi:LOW QUALITY PROTEIN: keratin, type II cytoskeletal 80-like [Microcaecilia unicolor]|uniref:LOW QUALITY PROTEIN: keratin, type II cytoskeletal 80-like n=1 Tax=Microcaecilia unicolor TaxID=1415580 RepID=A0A6P7XNE2_9AMPH|nr:LOW QUALITY PROTEIN: keratin, type II cytoskeletal 80-like [Microcaecilia unicolor]